MSQSSFRGQKNVQCVMNCFQPKYAWQILISTFKGAVLAQFPTYSSTAVVFQGASKPKGDFAL